MPSEGGGRGGGAATALCLRFTRFIGERCCPAALRRAPTCSPDYLFSVMVLLLLLPAGRFCPRCALLWSESLSPWLEPGSGAGPAGQASSAHRAGHGIRRRGQTMSLHYTTHGTSSHRHAAPWRTGADQWQWRLQSAAFLVNAEDLFSGADREGGRGGLAWPGEGGVDRCAVRDLRSAPRGRGGFPVI